MELVITTVSYIPNILYVLLTESDIAGRFKMYEGDIQNDHECKDPNQLYTVICLESCAYPNNYLCWASIPEQPKPNKESVKIQVRCMIYDVIYNCCFCY